MSYTESMSSYTLLAWMPGSGMFVAKDPNGAVGLLKYPYDFTPKKSYFYESAVGKHHYEPMQETVVRSADSLDRVIRALEQGRG